MNFWESELGELTDGDFILMMRSNDASKWNAINL
jgi:hypothetical protein